MKTKSILVQILTCTLLLLQSSNLSATSVPLKTYFSEEDNICNGDVILRSQAEVDVFATNNYTEITGFLKIRTDDPSPSDIDDLTGLSSLTIIGGQVNIARNPLLTTLDGLENLNSIGGNLDIHGNAALTTLASLGGLTSIKEGVAVSNCDGLTDLMGLHNVTFPAGDITNFYIAHNPSLTSLAGLDQLTVVHGDFNLYNNPQLTTLINLENLTTIGRSLEIVENHGLSTLEGLDNLTTVDKDLVLFRNNGLVDITSLTNIDAVGEFLVISYNEVLSTLEGLENIASTGSGLSIEENPLLSNCCFIQDLINGAGTNQVIDIKNNATECDSKTAINSYCTDNDGDGFVEQDDCDDNDPTINPAATEICDGKDNNCDGSTDEGLGGVFVGDVDLNTQAQVDAFALNCYNEITGDLNIGATNGIVSTDVHDLSGLSNLTIIGGDLFIVETDLTHLNGFENLVSTGGVLSMLRNDLLESISALQSLTSVERTFAIVENPALHNLAGLTNLTTVESLVISKNASLNSISGFSNIAPIDGVIDFLFIDNNPLLTSLVGLENITMINGSLDINHNDALINFNGLNHLTTVTSLMVINDNAALSSFEGLESLTTLGFVFSIAGNPSLTTLAGLENVATVAQHFLLKNNTTLTDCCSINDLLNSGNIGGSIDIVNNATACDSQTAIENNCTDNDGDGFVDKDDCDDNDPTINPAATEICDGKDNNCDGSTDEGLGGVFVGDVTLFTQAGVAAFALNCYSEITGNLTIGVIDGNIPTDINDLTALNNLTTIGGTLSFKRNPLLTSLSGMENIHSIGNNLEIFANDGLNNLTGLDGIHTVEGSLTVVNNNALLTLNGLENVSAVNGSFLYININDALISLTGLEGITTLNGLEISQNASLVDFSGLNNLTTIAGRLELVTNAALTTLAALGNLTSVGGHLVVFNNDALTDLEGLNQVMSVGQDLAVTQNDKLTSLTGLENVETVGGGLYINNNPILTDCCAVLDLINGTGVTGPIAFENNASSCDSEAAIEADCSVVEISCDDITATVSPGTIHLSGLTAPNEIIKIYNFNWTRVVYQCSYSQDCGNDLTISDLEPGDYNIHVQFFNPNCQKVIRVTVPENTCVIEVSGDVSCINGTGNISLNILDVTYPVSSYTFEWSNGATTPVVGGLASGNYSVVITSSQGCSETLSFIISESLCGGNCIDEDDDGYCDDNGEDCAPNNPNLPTTPGTACDDGDATTENDVIQADGCTCTGTPIGEEFDCENVDIQAGNGSLTISQLNTDYVVVRVYAPNWQLLQQCASWSGSGLPVCDSPITITGLSDGNHHIQIQAYEGPWSNKFCSEMFHIKVTTDGCLDSDNDGYCDDEDCEPNNPNLPTAPGTSCDDGDPTTSNDEIQEDGCSCQGTIDTGSNISLNCPNNITVTETAPGEGALVYWSLPSATTDCPSINVQLNQTAGPPNNSIFESGETTISYMATDECGAVATCSFVVTVIESIPNPEPTGYCDSKGQSPWNEWISRVQFRDIDKESGKDRYGDFTDQMTFVFRGGFHEISISPAFSWTQYDEYVRIWIDFNKDGDFDDSDELVLSAISPKGVAGHTPSPIIGLIEIPSYVGNGPTRMRVSMKRDDYAAPCEVFQFGEVEDYLLNIQPGLHQGGTHIRSIATNEIVKSAMDIQLFPNPATTNLTVQLTRPVEENTDLILYNYLGQEVYRQVVTPINSSRLTIDLKGIETGLYILSLQRKGQATLSKRLIVK